MHLPVHGDRVLEPQGGAGAGGQFGVGADADDDQHHARQAGDHRAVSGLGVDPQPPALARGGGGDLPGGGAGEDFDAACHQFGPDQAPQCRVDGGQDFGELFHLDDRQAPGGQGVGHLQADVPGADDYRGGRGGGFEGAHHREGVAHRVQQVHPVARA